MLLKASVRGLVPEGGNLPSKGFLIVNLGVSLFIRQPNANDFVTVRASVLNAKQQLSTRSVQQVQYQSVKNHRFQQISITC